MIEQFKKGIFYTAMGKYSIAIVQIVVTAFISRLITPDEYGIVSAVNVFLVFFQLLADFGLGPAIIQNKDLSSKEINSIFSFSLYIAVGLSILFVFLGYPMSLFFGNEVYISVSRVLAVAVFFYGVLVVPQSLLLKQQNFKLVNITTLIAAVVSGAVSITFALLGFSYYSLIIGNTAKALTLFIVFYLNTETKISLQFEWGPLKKIFAFSRNQFLFNFINFFSQNLDKLLIGRYFSSSALGYYDRAYQVSLYPNQILTSLIASVIHPILSEYESEKERIKKVYLQISNVLAILGMPLSVFLFFTARDVILLLSGPDWLGGVAVLQILALTVWIQMILASTGGIFKSGNRTDLMLLSGLLSTTLNVIGIVIGIVMGRIEYVAFSLLISFGINFIQANFLLMKIMFKSSMMEFFAVLKKPAILALLQAVVFYFLPEISINVFMNIVVKGFIFLIVWLIGMYLTGEMKRFIKELKQLRA